MTEEEIKKLVELQRSYFYTGATRPVKTRIEHLKKLKDWVTAHEEDINKALGEDLGKSSFESYMCEAGLILNELTHMIRNVDEYAEEQDVHTPMSVCRAQLQEACSLRDSPCYESVELSVSPLDRTADRRACSRKYRDPQAKCLLSCHDNAHSDSGTGMF